MSSFASGKPAFNPNSALQSLKAYGDQERKRLDAQNQVQRQQSQHTQAVNNDLTAQRYALDQSYMMQQNSDNPRNITDTSMSISSGVPQQSPGNGSRNTGSSAVSALGKIGTIGGGNGPTVDIPGVTGRFMPLVGMSAPSSAFPASAPTPQVQLPDAPFTPDNADEFQNAEFAKAKAQAGSLGRSAVTSLRDELAGRGIMGSGTEMRGIADRLAAATNPLSDINVAHLGQDYTASQRERDRAEQHVQTGYQGAIAQRNQDMNQQQALNALKAALMQTQYSGEINQRGQDLSALYRLL